MSEARIKTSFGEIVVSYSSLDELSKALDEIPKAVELVLSKAGTVAPSEPRKPKPGCEQIYRFGPDGQLELLRRPQKKVALVALALYAYDPQPLTAEQIEAFTGLSDVAKNVLNAGANKKYFVFRGNGGYGLSQFGFQWVTSRVVPTLA